MTKEEAEEYIGKYCSITWATGSMAGWIEEVDAEGDIWLDWGYGINVEDVLKIEEMEEPEWDSRS